MSRNGSGTYNLPAGNPVVTGSTISSTWANNTLNDIATALTGSIAKDGQTTPTGNLPMGGYAHTNVADATVRTMYGTAGQIQDSAFTFLTSPAGTNAMTATAALGMSAYVIGQRFFFVAPSTNTGACTLNINAIGAKALTKSGTTALVAGDIQSGSVVQVVYDGTQFQLLNPSLSALGTMSTQNANAVAITGGTITGTSFTGNVTGNVSGNAGTVTNGVYTSDFAKSLSANGYQKLPGGLILQWMTGTSTGTIAPQTNISVTTNWPISFPNACLSAQVTATGAANLIGGPTIISTSTTSIVVNFANCATSNSYSVTPIIFGIGY